MVSIARQRPLCLLPEMPEDRLGHIGPGVPRCFCVDTFNGNESDFAYRDFCGI
jgi:hypothetical protein